MKPHKGKLLNAVKMDFPEGSVYCGLFDGHPEFHGRRGHTSKVIKDNCDELRHGFDSYEIETLNSRYTIVPKNVEGKTFSGPDRLDTD